MNTNKSDNESRRLIQNQHFLNENNLIQYIEWDALARKGKSSSCHFEDCKITNSDMTKVEFYDTHFKNCEFLGVDLSASDFDSCKLETTRFLKSNLNLILVENIKVWESKEWVEIEDFSSFQNPNLSVRVLAELNFFSL